MRVVHVLIALGILAGTHARAAEPPWPPAPPAPPGWFQYPATGTRNNGGGPTLVLLAALVIALGRRKVAHRLEVPTKRVGGGLKPTGDGFSALEGGLKPAEDALAAAGRRFETG